MGSVQLQAGKPLEFAVLGEEVANAFASLVNTPATVHQVQNRLTTDCFSA